MDYIFPVTKNIVHQAIPSAAKPDTTKNLDGMDTFISAADQSAMGLSKLAPPERRHLNAWLIKELSEANARNRLQRMGRQDRGSRRRGRVAAGHTAP